MIDANHAEARYSMLPQECVACTACVRAEQKARNRNPYVSGIHEHEHMTNKSTPANAQSQALALCSVVGVRKQGRTRARDKRGQKDPTGLVVGDDVYAAISHKNALQTQAADNSAQGDNLNQLKPSAELSPH